jgi:hypothetical protein
MTAYKKLRKSYNLIFSHAKLPDGITNLIEDGAPNEQAAELSYFLSNSPPMLSFIFATKDQKPPTIISMFSIMQQGYTATAEDSQLHDTYGLLLDSLRIIAAKSPTAKVTEQKGEVTKVDLEPQVSQYDALRSGTVLQIENNICALRVAPITEFVL